MYLRLLPLISLLMLLAHQLFASDARIIDASRYGLIGDGQPSDPAAWQQAIQAATGQTLFLPAGEYLIDRNIPVQLSGDLTIQGEPGKTTLLFAGNASLSVEGNQVGSTFALVLPVTRGSRILQLDQPVDAAQPGDIVTLYEPTIAEIHWRSPKRHTSLVQSTDPAGIITLKDPLNFDFDPAAQATVHIHRPLGRLAFQHLTLRAVDPDRTHTAMVRISHQRDMQMHHLHIQGNTDFRHRGIHLSACLDSYFSHITFNQIQYGFLVNASRNMTFEHVTSHNTRHPITIAAWTDTVHVNHLHGNNNQGIVEAHPSFNIHYNHVAAGIEASVSNLRSVGGSIRNAVFTYLGPPAQPYIQTVALTDPSIYRDYTFEMENVWWKASSRLYVRNVGKAILRNVHCFDLEGNNLGVGVGPEVMQVIFEQTQPYPMLQPDHRYLPANVWSMAGPFPADHARQVKAAMQRVFEPEAELLEHGRVDLHAAYADGAEGSVRWHRLGPDEPLTGSAVHHMQQGVNFTASLGMQRLGVAYALTYIHSPDDRDVTLYIGCDYWAKAWLNAQPIHGPRTPEQIDTDGATFRTFASLPAPIRLRQGQNILMVKVHGGSGGVSFTAGLSNAQNLQFSPVPFDHE